MIESPKKKVRISTHFTVELTYSGERMVDEDTAEELSQLLADGQDEKAAWILEELWQAKGPDEVTGGDVHDFQILEGERHQ